ncbi:MAG: hypothetical protein ABID61_00195 [Candidatus Micrarchaeota archaeon]
MHNVFTDCPCCKKLVRITDGSEPGKMLTEKLKTGYGRFVQQRMCMPCCEGNFD